MICNLKGICGILDIRGKFIFWLNCDRRIEYFQLSKNVCKDFFHEPIPNNEPNSSCQLGFYGSSWWIPDHHACQNLLLSFSCGCSLVKAQVSCHCLLHPNISFWPNSWILMHAIQSFLLRACQGRWQGKHPPYSTVFHCWCKSHQRHAPNPLFAEFQLQCTPWLADIAFVLSNVQDGNDHTRWVIVQSETLTVLVKMIRWYQLLHTIGLALTQGNSSLPKNHNT